LKYETVLLVGAGIGVTPFASYVWSFFPWLYVRPIPSSLGFSSRSGIAWTAWGIPNPLACPR
jgi:hypothetical protein